MDNEDNQVPFCTNNQPYNTANSLLSNLLQEVVTGRDIFLSQPTASHKQEPLQDQEVQQNQRFDLRSIEKQEFIRTFPEKLYPEQPEEDVLQMSIGFRKCLIDSPSLQKKSIQINKTAYLNQNREDKLARYREKKSRRVWERKISYDCRKVVADKRQRKNGRFVKKDEDKDKQSPSKNKEIKIQISAKQQDISFKVEEYYD